MYGTFQQHARVFIYYYFSIDSPWHSKKSPVKAVTSMSSLSSPISVGRPLLLRIPYRPSPSHSSPTWAALWNGSHLLQEHNSNGLYTYIYTDQDSYEPLAQVRDWTTADGENRQQTNYFHCDQIGIPREMTDKDGNLLWFGEYDVGVN